MNLEFIVKLWKIYFYYNLLLLFVSIALIIGTVLKCIKQEIGVGLITRACSLSR